MQQDQDWCLQCGAAAPGSLLPGGPGWRTGVAILGATGVLVAGAAVAAYAALNKTKPHSTVVAVVAKTVTATSTPTPTVSATPTPGTPTTVKPAPKIPLQTSTPKSSSGAGLFPPEAKTTPTPTTTKTTPTKTSEQTTGTGKGTNGEETEKSGEGPSPILLDTDAASVYNPYGFPASLFGDPSLAIDGEPGTAWTAQVQAGVAPKMAEGLVLDLKEPLKLGSAKVITTSPGVTVEIYGANGSSLPTTIQTSAWARLVGLKVLHKKTTTLKLKTHDKPYRYVLLWLVKAPHGSTETAPGTVSINEFELFPPSS